MILKKYEKYINKNGRLVSDVPAHIYDQIREDALKSSGLWGHPKADAFYAKAWNSYEFGLEEVFSTLEAIAEMVFYNDNTHGQSKMNH